MLVQRVHLLGKLIWALGLLSPWIHSRLHLLPQRTISLLQHFYAVSLTTVAVSMRCTLTVSPWLNTINSDRLTRHLELQYWISKTA